MQIDAIEALERTAAGGEALALCDWRDLKALVEARREGDAALIRQHIADLRAGVRRADVVALVRERRQHHFDRAHLPVPKVAMTGEPSRMGEDLRLMSRAKASACDEIADAIERGAAGDEA